MKLKNNRIVGGTASLEIVSVRPLLKGPFPPAGMYDACAPPSPPIDHSPLSLITILCINVYYSHHPIVLSLFVHISTSSLCCRLLNGKNIASSIFQPRCLGESMAQSEDPSRFGRMNESLRFPNGTCFFPCREQECVFAQNGVLIKCDSLSLDPICIGFETHRKIVARSRPYWF